MSSRVRISPTITLYGIDVNSSLSDSKFLVPRFPDKLLVFLEGQSKLKKKLGTTEQDDAHRVTNNAMEVKEIYSINGPAYRGEGGGICKNCLRTYTGESFGYCHKKRYGSKGVDHLTKDNFNCSPMCALGYLDTLRIDSPRQRLEYETLTGELYSGVIKSNDWRLLASGVCDEEDWDANVYTYTRLPGVEIIPTKEEYVKTRR
jgi:hypothetical protein